MPGKLRVLMTADTVGGVWTYAMELARALADRAEISVATMGAPLSAAQRAAAMEANVHVCESGFRLEWMEDPWNDIAAAGDWLLDLESRLHPRLIHLNNFAHGSLPWRAPSVMVGHSCVCSWWEAVHGRTAPAEWDRYRAAVGEGLRAASVVVAATGAMLRSLERFYGPLRDARVVPNGVDASHFAPAVKEPFILSAGRLWDDAKNIRRLAEIAPLLPWPVYVAGDMRSPDGHECAIDNVRTLGFVDRPQLARWMGRAGIYVLPARYEPFGLTVLEAALSGCAPVIGDIPSLREIWADAAWYVAPDDAAGLRDAIELLIQDEEERTRLAQRARTRGALFSLQRMADEYWDLYTELVGIGLKSFRRRCKL